ncbi:MAG: hypothetical protein EOM15_13340 [Spirochaetia bacterium]|nr:hypothetical protein [Spirochaetia bacterium]
MNTVKKLTLCLLLLMQATFSFGASERCYPYLTFTKGFMKGEEEKDRFYEVSLGTTLASRTAIETFCLVQQIDTAQSQNSEEQLALTAGLKADVKLFKNATLNPMIVGGIGQMFLLHARSTDQSLQSNLSFYSSLATGFEINIFDTVRIHVLSGYRFCPHRGLGCLERNALSSPFSSISIRALGHYASN